MDPDTDTGTDTPDTDAQHDTPPANTTPAPQARTVPYARFQDVNRRKGELEGLVATLTQERDSAVKERDAARADVVKSQRDAIVARVAADLRLPAKLAERLQGDDEAAIRADAAALLEGLAPAPAPDIDARTGNADQQTQAPTFTRAQLRDPQFYQANRDAIMAAVRDGRISDG